MNTSGKTQEKKLELSDLKNVGKAFLDKFEKLGVTSVADLAKESADELYIRLCKIERERLDPCVHDVFAATIQQAKTGQAQNWWAFSSERKVRQDQNDFPEIKKQAGKGK